MNDRSLFDKIWDSHVIESESGCPSILYIDLHLIHEVSSPQAFDTIRKRNLKVRRPDRTVATMDHIVPTKAQGLPITDPLAAKLVTELKRNCSHFGITLFDLGDKDQGIVHVIGPDLGLTQPGMTVVCGDSHTSTHGALGAFALGIGSTEVQHVLATQCILQKKPETFEVRIEGNLQPGVSAKDIILALIAKIGAGGAQGTVIEYTGDTIGTLNMDERMTICNMSIEAGARAGIMGPDDTTFQYLAEKRFAPRGPAWERALIEWQQLRSDVHSFYDRSVTLDAGILEPMITYGTNPGMAIPISSRIPDPAAFSDLSQRKVVTRALDYMGFKPGQPMLGKTVDVVFIGSCTNSRLSDLRAAAAILKGRKVQSGLRVLVVPGSRSIKRQAESEGLDRIFLEAGAEWREPGCSMCIAINGDELKPGQYCVSTSNRNFEGRQGPGGRTMLASPLTAAATAISGAVADVRRLLSSTDSIG